jgi:hypothetical protein
VTNTNKEITSQSRFESLSMLYLLCPLN